MKAILITGVSSGIGYHAAAHFSEKGYRVFGSVRTQEDANRLSTAFGPLFFPLLFDVRDEEAIRSAVITIEEELGENALDAIINNAGIAVTGPLTELDIAQFEASLDTNVTGVMRVTQQFFPLLRKYRQNGKQAGRIINVGSVSGRIAYPFLGPYAASKFALRGLTDALRREMLIYDVKVVLIEASNIVSDIWQKAKDTPDTFVETDYGFILKHKDRILSKLIRDALPPKHILKVIDKALHNSRPARSYLVARQPWKTRLFTFIIPGAWIDRLMQRNFKKAKTIEST